MSGVLDSGWKKAEVSPGQPTIADDEIRHIFSLIDTDESGFLTGKVINREALHMHPFKQQSNAKGMG